MKPISAIILFLLLIALPIVSTAQATLEKKKLSLTISYQQKNNELPIIKVSAKTKPEKKFVPVEGVELNLFFNEETANGFMAKVKSNLYGEAKVTLPLRFKNSWDSSASYLFIATAVNQDQYLDASTEIEITKADY